jgi:hypothetical protein
MRNRIRARLQKARTQPDPQPDNLGQNAAKSEYTYRPLRLASSIRLIKVEGSKDSPIYTLLHTTLDKAPPYETLSYVWGSPERRHPLELRDGTVLHITHTLRDILPKIHAYITTGYLWIDQLCINQANSAERGVQVALMGMVYSSCYGVIVWLGIERCREMQLTSQVFGWDARGLKPNSTSYPAPVGPDVIRQTVETLQDTLKSQRTFRIFYNNIMTARWFSRAWVFQEIVLAPRSCFILPCDDHGTRAYGALSLEDIFLLSGSFSKTNHWIVDDATLEISEMYQHWMGRHVPNAPIVAPLERTLLRLSHRAKTSEHLDTLFAFFGLNHDFSIKLQPSYDLSMAQNLVQCASSIINGTRRLDILEVVGMATKAALWPPRIPSWTPDFCQLPHRIPLIRPAAHERRSDASQSMYAWQGSCDLRTLRVHGRIIDTTDRVLGPSQSEHTTEDWILKVYQDFIGHSTDLSDHPDQLSPEDSSQRILQAMFLGGYCQPEDFDDAEFEDIARMLKASTISTSTNEGPGESPRIECNSICSRYSTKAQALARVLYCLARIMNGRQVHVTRHGRLAVLIQPDWYSVVTADLYILHGSRYPIAIKPYSGNVNEVLGACYVEGWMDAWGSGKIDWKEEDAQEFEIV